MKIEQAKQLEAIKKLNYAILSHGTVGDVWFEDEFETEKSESRTSVKRQPLEN